MDFMAIIQDLELMLENAKKAPLSNKKAVDAEEMGAALAELKQSVPDEIKQSQLVLEREAYILEDAKRNAGLIIGEAEEKARAMVEEHEITQRAHERGDEIMDNARTNGREIREGSLHYASDMLHELKMKLEDHLSMVNTNLQEFEQKSPEAEPRSSLLPTLDD